MLFFAQRGFITSTPEKPNEFVLFHLNSCRKQIIINTGRLLQYPQHCHLIWNTTSRPATRENMHWELDKGTGGRVCLKCVVRSVGDFVLSKFFFGAIRWRFVGWCRRHEHGKYCSNRGRWCGEWCWRWCHRRCCRWEGRQLGPGWREDTTLPVWSCWSEYFVKMYKKLSSKQMIYVDLVHYYYYLGFIFLY